MPREADSRGNITSETRNGVTVTYEYDELGQLTRVNDPGDPAADSDNGTTWLFTYDRGGNILSKQAYVLSTAAQPTELRQNLIYGYTDANWKDKLTHFCNDELTYDAIGNLTGDIKWTYVWEKGRQLKSMHNAATGVTMEFKYNSEGIRTQKVKKVNGAVIETTDYILKGKHVVAMKKNTDTYYFTYDASGRPATVTYNGAKYTYVKNLQGDIVGILDASGNLVIEYRYDAWGAPTSILCVNIACDDLAFDNPFRYRGYVWDEETELYYLRSRYYRPEWGRFDNADNSLGQGIAIFHHSLFTYCKNSTLVYYDPDGAAFLAALYYYGSLYLTHIMASPDINRDIESLALSIAEGNVAGIVFDTIGIAIPGLPSFKHVKVIGSADEVAQIGKTAKVIQIFDDANVEDVLAAQKHHGLPVPPMRVITQTVPDIAATGIRRNDWIFRAKDLKSHWGYDDMHRDLTQALINKLEQYETLMQAGEFTRDDLTEILRDVYFEERFRNNFGYVYFK